MKKFPLAVVICLVVAVPCFSYGKGGGHSGGGSRGSSGHFSGGSHGFSGARPGSTGHSLGYTGRSFGGSYGFSGARPGGTGHSLGYTGHSPVVSHAPLGTHYGSGTRWYGGYSHGGRHYGGYYYGRYPRYYYSGYAPSGAIFGAFLGGIVVGGVYNPFWWPYYAVPVPPSYYDPYYQYPYPAPAYVIEVPPEEVASTDPQMPPPATAPPNQCYAPKTDSSGGVIKDDNGNMAPDFSKPVPCPPQS